MGNQAYSINFGKHSYSINWGSPAATALIIGAEFWNVMSSEEGWSFKQAVESLTKVADPILDTGMLQTVDNMLNNVRYKNSPVLGILGEAVASYVNQYLPSIGGALARTIDPYQRQTYMDKNSDIPVGLDMPLQKAMLKIPGVSYALKPSVDVWGNVRERGNLFTRIISNFASPGYYSELSNDPVNLKIAKLYKDTGDKSVIPRYAPKSFTADNETVNLTAREQTAMSEKQGKSSYGIVKKLFDNKNYVGMNGAEKSYAIGRIYDYSYQNAKKEVKGVVPESWVERLTLAVENGYNPAEFIAFKAKIREADDNGQVSKADAVSAFKGTGMSKEKMGVYFDLLGVDAKNPYYRAPFIRDYLKERDKAAKDEGEDKGKKKKVEVVWEEE
jgi:hypothetical protein